ncbi:MAG: hypothetical protein COA96_16625, partial [SAR86 cluster bacterium]
MQLKHIALSLLLPLAGITAGTNLIAAENIEPSLTADEIELSQWLDDQNENMLDLLERITNINSGSLNKAGVNEMAALFTRELQM